MNRRHLLTAIPAAVAALTASKSLVGATSSVDASEAIAGPSETFTHVYERPGLSSDYHELLLRSYAAVPCVGPEMIHFANGDIAVMREGYSVPAMTYVAPRGVEG